MFKRSSRFQRPSQKRFSWISGKIFKRLGWMGVILLLMVGGWWFFTAVKTIFVVSLDEITCTDQAGIKAVLEQENIKFYWLQSQEIERKLKQDFSCINEVHVERKFPTSVAVTLSGRKPVAVFRVIQKFTPSPLPLEEFEASSSTQEAKPSPTPSPQVTVTYGETFLVDTKGVGYSKGSREGLPFVDYVAVKFDIGDTIGGERIQRILQIVQFFQSQGIMIASLEMDNDKLVVKTTEEIVFSLAEGLERQGASLQLIWKQAKMNSKSVVKIDLRFDKPVVVYLPEKK